MAYQEVKSLGATLTECSIPYKFFTFRYQVSGADDPEPGLRAAYEWQTAFVDGLIGAPVVMAVKPPEEEPAQEAHTGEDVGRPEEPQRIPDGDGTADIRALPGPLTIAHVVSENGTHFCKVFGAPFTKYGVRVWPEVLGAANIKGWADWPVGEKKPLPQGMAAFVQFDGKKPLKVTSLQ